MAGRDQSRRQRASASPGNLSSPDRGTGLAAPMIPVLRL